MISRILVWAAKTLRSGMKIGCIAGLVAFCADAEAQETPAPGVLVETVAIRSVTDTDTFSGRVLASSKVDIVAQASGIVTEIHFEEGY